MTSLAVYAGTASAPGTAVHYGWNIGP
jgi:hypothetical protein